MDLLGWGCQGFIKKYPKYAASLCEPDECIDPKLVERDSDALYYVRGKIYYFDFVQNGQSSTHHFFVKKYIKIRNGKIDRLDCKFEKEFTAEQQTSPLITGKPNTAPPPTPLSSFELQIALGSCLLTAAGYIGPIGLKSTFEFTKNGDVKFQKNLTEFILDNWRN